MILMTELFVAVMMFYIARLPLICRLMMAFAKLEEEDDFTELLLAPDVTGNVHSGTNISHSFIYHFR